MAEKPIQVDKAKFDLLLAKMIATPPLRKDEIVTKRSKPKKKTA
jgi:hypothetical protein